MAIIVVHTRSSCEPDAWIVEKGPAEPSVVSYILGSIDAIPTKELKKKLLTYVMGAKYHDAINLWGEITEETFDFIPVSHNYTNDTDLSWKAQRLLNSVG